MILIIIILMIIDLDNDDNNNNNDNDYHIVFSNKKCWVIYKSTYFTLVTFVVDPGTCLLIFSLVYKNIWL